ncbi:UDP-N-acetylmuramoyl-tripeptide--D-alanyl-D-alanine ligase [Marinibacterium profundimaris]|uniref:UDP-N-acetylmuramoyl-tripeptide--D-alanyl-D-alanine ligase n=1 Tax=Marinibacterium profundimaris TaxID=1679460 RepID=A0A225NT08_9RHOB|nr:UDP-N-acetylmuramoyl-tripeptide--D-alanyl-D-alanine ligase [Marinibacterium profundimaris]OWU77982.1 UDP-N-acetylmuramoyl-tripeptide--D-alanyl-D-alanine ligase [Marinibacterium profundimaris]
MSLWTSRDAARATGGRSTVAWEADGVSIDTRTIQPGDLFVALKAARDGHEFVAQALEKGAAAALVTHVPEGVAEDAPLLIVDDVQTALEALGRAGRKRTKARVVAITGSVGKTSTKEMLAEVLSDQGRTHASVASYNNHWGVPLTLARMPADTEYAVIEIGMNHPGEIAPLAKMAQPHVAIVTTVAAAHLEAFENIEGIAAEKAAICEGLEPRGTAILNGDLDTYPILEAAARAKTARIVTFGESSRCHHRATDVHIASGATVVQARAWRTPLLYKVGAEGRHYAINALAVLAAVFALKADRGRAVLALAGWSAVSGRGQRMTVVLDPVDRHLALELIDDAYNANPTSMAAALEVLAAADPRDGLGRIAKGRRIAILGDMKELGPEAEALHAGLVELPSMRKIDVVHCVGPLMKALHAALPPAHRGMWHEETKPMLRGLRGRIDGGDVILVKGSLSMGLSRVVDAIRKMGHPDTQYDE